MRPAIPAALARRAAVLRAAVLRAAVLRAVPASTAVLGTAVLAGAAACSPARSGGTQAHDQGTITAIGAESQYADVIRQVGGADVTVTAIMSNPAIDPHTYEASAQVAQQINAAQLVVQNGLGYDSFMNTIENAQPDPARKVIDVQTLLGLPDSTPNPHLWYNPATMPKVANAIAAGLSQLDPAHANYFHAQARLFISRLDAWTSAIAAFRQRFPGVPVATTEPVADYMLQAAGADNLTPWTFQAAIMNGTDPSPQDIATERALFTQHKVKALLYNQQVTSTLTESFIRLAGQEGIPVVGVYETMPAGYDYQSWMLAELHALARAVTSNASTEHL